MYHSKFALSFIEHLYVQWFALQRQKSNHQLVGRHRSPSCLADIHDSILACCYQWGIYSSLSFTVAEMNNQLVWQRTGPMVIRVVLVSDRNFKVRCTFWFQEHSDVWRRSHGDVCGQGAGWFEISWPWNNQHLNVTISLPWGHNEHDDVSNHRHPYFVQPVMRQMFPFDDVITFLRKNSSSWSNVNENQVFTFTMCQGLVVMMERVCQGNGRVFPDWLARTDDCQSEDSCPTTIVTSCQWSKLVDTRSLLTCDSIFYKNKQVTEFNIK